MQDEKDKKIEELTKKLDLFQREFDSFKKSYSQHTHTGKDGSTVNKDSIELLSGQSFKAGSISLCDTPKAAKLQSGRFYGSIIIGTDSSMANGSENAQLNFDHQSETATNQTFIYAFRKPIAFGSTGSISSGGTTLAQTEFTFDVNALDGAFVDIYDNSTGTDVFTETFEIASNTAQVVTITGGTWSFSGTGLTFQIFMPVYLGAADFPFRRVYTAEGDVGGVRFGFGPTAGGQNGLLYMDSTGDLYWRNKAGSATKLN